MDPVKYPVKYPIVRWGWVVNHVPWSVESPEFLRVVLRTTKNQTRVVEGRDAWCGHRTVVGQRDIDLVGTTPEVARDLYLNKLNNAVNHALRGVAELEKRVAAVVALEFVE